MIGFIGTATPLTEGGIDGCAQKIGVSAIEIRTVLKVETSGCGYFSDRRPAILFERHKFSQFTGGKYDAAYPDISNPKAGGYSYGTAEYPRLEKAMALDETAALQSASWGLGQVMGYHASDLAYPSVEDYVTQNMASEDQQLVAMVEFVAFSNLVDALRSHDWVTFARGYNGPAYATNSYDKKLASAYKELSTQPPPDLTAREAQLRLLFLGFDPNGVDGLWGAGSTKALQAFEKKFGLPLTETADAPTLDALRKQQALLPVSTTPVIATTGTTALSA